MNIASPRLDGIPQPGDLIVGKYRVERVLGRGGMGVVVAAEHMALRQQVAVKLLLPDAMKVPAARERFFREARTAALVRSEHVARVLDVGGLDDGTPYLVMEQLAGTDLRALLAARGCLPAAQAVDYILQACEPIAEAHAMGIVHRDIKPANLFLADGPAGVPTIKVLDFGISKNILSEDLGADISITGDNILLGSLPYMAPEQVRGAKNVDTRADIWSLGVCLFQLITGRRPFEGSVLTQLLLMITMDPPPSFQSFNVSAPVGLEAVITWCLEKERGRRPQTIADLAEALERFGTRLLPPSTERILQLGRTKDASSGRWNASRDSSRLTPSSQGYSPSGVISPMAFGEGSASTSKPHASRAGETRATTSGATPAAPRSRKGRVAASLAAVLLGAFGIAKGLGALRHASSEIDPERLASFAPLPSSPSSRATSLQAARIKLGSALFHEPKLSRNGDVACSSCHPLERYGVDGKRRSRGSEDREPPRNTLSIYNTAGAFAYLWDGRMRTLEEQIEEALFSPTTMDSTKEQVEAALRSMPTYVKAFKEAFPEEAEPISVHNAQTSIAAFEGTLVTRGRWDRFLEGDKSALRDEEKAGFNRFVEVGCVSCHFGEGVGATMFQKVGLVKAWPDTRDRGRFEITKREADWMVFKVPSLRNVQKTGPYFHDGSVTSLEEAVRMMGRHQIGRELEEADVGLIVAWLGSLTGEIPKDASAPPASRN